MNAIIYVHTIEKNCVRDLKVQAQNTIAIKYFLLRK